MPGVPNVPGPGVVPAFTGAEPQTLPDPKVGTEWGLFDWGYGTWTVVSTPVSGADSATATDAGAVSATVSGAESGVVAEAGAVSATLSGSDAATASDAGQVSVPISSADSGTVTDSGSTGVTAAGTDAGAASETATASAGVSGSQAAIGSDTGVVTETGAGGEGGAGFDSGAVSTTASGADSGTASDAGTVQDVSGATPVSGSDSGTSLEAAFVTDLTPPQPTTGGGRYEGGDETEGETFRALRDGDAATFVEFGEVTDLRLGQLEDGPPPPDPRVAEVLLASVRRRRPEPQSAPAPVRFAEPDGSDSARVTESWHVLDLTPSVDDEDEFEALLASGALETLLA